MIYWFINLANLHHNLAIYKKQKTVMKVGRFSITDKMTKEIIQALSPNLFNLFIKEMIDKLKNNSKRI